MPGPPRSPSTQPTHCSEDDYTHIFSSDSNFYSAGDWIGSLPTGPMTPLHPASSSGAGSEIYMPATFDPRAANTFLMPVRFFPDSALTHTNFPSLTTKTQNQQTSQTPYSDPTATSLPPAASYYASPASTTSEPSFLTNSESPSYAAVPCSGEGTDSQSPELEKKPKRNRANRYKNAHPSVLSVSATSTHTSFTNSKIRKPKSTKENLLTYQTPCLQRRRAQNRESQRAYRRRKDDRITELEQLLGEATDRERTVSQAYISLKTEFDQLLVMGGTSSQKGGGSADDDHMSAGLLSPPQAMMYSSGADAGSIDSSSHDNPHLHHRSYSSSPGMQLPSPQM